MIIILPIYSPFTNYHWPIILIGDSCKNKITFFDRTKTQNLSTDLYLLLEEIDFVLLLQKLLLLSGNLRKHKDLFSLNIARNLRTLKDARYDSLRESNWIYCTTYLCRLIIYAIRACGYNISRPPIDPNDCNQRTANVYYTQLRAWPGQCAAGWKTGMFKQPRSGRVCPRVGSRR